MSRLDPASQYNHLFSASRITAPVSPLGGANWDSGLSGLSLDQTQFGNTGDSQRQSMTAIFQAGVQRDLAGQNQMGRFQQSLSQLTPGQVQNLYGLVSQAGTQAEQVFILKAFTMGENWQNLVQYANEMRGFSEQEIISRSTMRDDADVIQQWQDSCGPGMLQTIAGEADPRFAWELNKAGDISRIDPLGANKIVADQQKQWLEQYGGVAVQRGQSGGTGIAIGDMLNQTVGPMIGARYDTIEASNVGSAMDTIQQRLQAGFDVPLRISWDPPGGADSGHFILAMAVRGTPGNRELQIHDVWTGKTAWVSERNIENNNFGPIFNSYARLSHFYYPQAA